MNLTLSRLFDAAYGVLDRPDINLAKGSYGMESEHQFCTIGALRQAAFGQTYGYVEEHPHWDLYRKAFLILTTNLPDGPLDGHIPSWNDAAERTKADVLALFRGLAAKTAETEASA